MKREGIHKFCMSAFKAAKKGQTRMAICHSRVLLCHLGELAEDVPRGLDGGLEL
jgi:hypothetical protein